MVKILVIGQPSGAGIFSRPEWRVEKVSGVRECLSKFTAEHFDIAVLDLGPNRGLDGLREILSHAPATPVLALVPDPTPSFVRQAMEAGVFECLALPVSAAALQSAVGSAVQAYGAPSGRRMIRGKPELCAACLSCTVACALAKLGLPGDTPLQTAMLSAARLFVVAAGAYSVPLLCLQCADAPCMSVCPGQALRRAEACGPVFADVSRCIGCGRCALACPGGVLALDSRHRLVQKCDLCLGRTQAGQEPACVETCPMDALELVSADGTLEGA